MGRLLDFIFPSRKPPYGGYILEEEIASGGMSRIWRARHPEDGRVCVVKVLTPESADLQATFSRAFEAEEGQIALRLEHPYVIKTYDYGRHGKDTYYIVMEYVDGPNLETLVLLQEPRVRAKRFELILQIGEGLTYIHEQGLIHRDFCPKNVLYGREAIPKIIDFGLSIPAGVSHRLAEARAGTASYMAPEQVRGQAVDKRADIYAFGLSAFEILPGRRPFPQSADRSRRMQDHLNVEPIKLREADPDLPEELEQVVQKCIAKQRDLRYKSMPEVMRDLRVAVRAA